MFPRAMNNKEKSMLATIKEYGFAYELKFHKSPYSNGSYMANIPILKETWCLNSPLSEKHKENIKKYFVGMQAEYCCQLKFKYNVFISKINT